MIKLNDIYNLDLDNTITCGQIFRFTQEKDGSYTVILNDRVVNLKYENNTLLVDSNKLDDLENIIRNYLDLDRDYNKLLDNIKNKDKKIENLINNSIGLKMIKQEPLECIIEYIISQNNSVKNIANSLNLISEYYGDKVIFRNKVYYLFPKLDKLININEEEFRKCKVGFRDKYLVNIINAIYNKDLDIEKIKTMSSPDAINYLKSFKGIGMKVASCILLFSYQRFDVFPIDTWVKKFMKENYNIEGEENIRKYCLNTFNLYSGLAIQYMFNGMRNKN